MEGRSLGLTIPFGPGLDDGDALRRLHRAGYSDFWTAETSRFDAFSPLVAAAAAVPAASLGTAIASVYARGPGLLAMQASAVAHAAPGRFTLGVGASSSMMTQQWHAADPRRPVSRVRDTALFLTEAFTGGLVDRAYETFNVGRFRLEDPPEHVPPILVAALRPAMLGVAARFGGAVLNWLSADDVRTAREHLDVDSRVVARIFVCCSTDVDAVRTRARRLIAGYLTTPGYAAYHRWLGRGTALGPVWDAWDRGERREAAMLVPDAVVDDLFVHGTPDECARHVERYVEAGVDVPVLKFLTSGEGDDPTAQALAVAAAYDR